MKNESVSADTRQLRKGFRISLLGTLAASCVAVVIVAATPTEDESRIWGAGIVFFMATMLTACAASYVSIRRSEAEFGRQAWPAIFRNWIPIGVAIFATSATGLHPGAAIMLLLGTAPIYWIAQLVSSFVAGAMNERDIKRGRVA